MRRRRYLVGLLLAACAVIPVLFGVSCPPPSNPAFISLQTSPANVNLSLPPCEPERVCVSVVNLACVDAEAALYIHDGFDLDREFATEIAFECCDNPNSTVACPCLRTGALNGELQLQRPELFIDDNLFEISGEDVIALPPNGRILQSFRCEEIKSIGLEAGGVGSLTDDPGDRTGPDYRCQLTEPSAGQRDTEFQAEEDVPCGATIQYTVFDRNDCADPSLTVFRITTDTSQTCADATTNPGAAAGNGGN